MDSMDIIAISYWNEPQVRKISMDETRNQEAQLSCLIKHYDRKEKKYKFEKQEIKNLTFDELKCVLKGITAVSTDKSIPDIQKIFPAQIVTEDLILEGSDSNDGCIIRRNLLKDEDRIPILISEVESVFQCGKDYWKTRSTHLRSKAFQEFGFWIVVPILNIINLVLFLMQGALTILLGNLLIILFGFSFLIIGITIYILYRRIVPFMAKDLKYSIPFLDDFETEDVSKYIIAIGQYLYPFVYGFQSPIVLAILFIFGLVAGYKCISYFRKSYRKKHQVKDAVLEVLYDRINSVNNQSWEAQDYYLKLVIEIRKRGLLRPSWLLTIITVLSLILPLLLNFI